MAIKINPTKPPSIIKNNGSITLPMMACWCSISSEYCVLSLSKINSGAFTSSDTLIKETNFLGNIECSDKLSCSCFPA